MKDNTRRLSKSGRGANTSLTLPIDIIRALKWRKNQKVVVKRFFNFIIIKKI